LTPFRGAAREGRTGGQFATFEVDGLLFGVDVLEVQEVLRAQEMTRVPKAPRVIEGLINLRGEIVMAISMRKRLGLEPRPASEAMNMVIRGEDGAVSLLVDEIGDVIEVSVDAFEPAPPTLAESCREVIDGLYKLDGRLMLALNTSCVLGAEGRVLDGRTK
jgi:purine-binding chemotaxis protein CheW